MGPSESGVGTLNWTLGYQVYRGLGTCGEMVYTPDIPLPTTVRDMGYLWPSISHVGTALSTSGPRWSKRGRNTGIWGLASQVHHLVAFVVLRIHESGYPGYPGIHGILGLGALHEGLGAMRV